ncbi:MAG TPA: hypothetical protein VIJ66_04615 [Solirubrobacteraceae bacterium]
MEQPTKKQPAIPYPRTPDGKYMYTASDGRPKHFPSTKLPGPVGPDFPFPPSVAKLFRKLFHRGATPAAR